MGDDCCEVCMLEEEKLAAGLEPAVDVTTDDGKLGMNVAVVDMFNGWLENNGPLGV